MYVLLVNLTDNICPHCLKKKPIVCSGTLLKELNISIDEKFL